MRPPVIVILGRGDRVGGNLQLDSATTVVRHQTVLVTRPRKASRIRTGRIVARSRRHASCTTTGDSDWTSAVDMGCRLTRQSIHLDSEFDMIIFCSKQRSSTTFLDRVVDRGKDMRALAGSRNSPWLAAKRQSRSQ